MAIITKLISKRTLKCAHHFKTPCTCYKFIFIMFSFYFVMIYIEHVPYDCEEFTNQCKVYYLVLGLFIKSPKERSVKCCWPCNEL